MKFIIQLIISTLAVLLSSYLLPGVEVDGIVTALIVAAVIAFLNAILRPILIILTIPITLVSFGSFLIVINAIIILITVKLVDGFSVRNFWWALLFGVVLWLTTMIMEGLNKKSENKNRDY